MWGQLQRHRDGVDDPAQDEFPGGPISVALLQLFRGRRFLLMRTVESIEGSENFVQRVKQGATNGGQGTGVALPDANEVVYKDVDLGERLFTRSRVVGPS